GAGPASAVQGRAFNDALMWRRLLLPGLAAFLLLSGCSGRLDNDSIIHTRSPLKPSEVLQTDVDRMATLAMRNNLNSLYRLMNKLYQRNPREWRKNSLPDAAAAERAIQYAIEHNQDWPTLGGRRDIEALDYSLSPAFQGDRVAAFTYAIGSMLVTAHGGRTEFYLTDSFNAQFIHNAARNLEKAGWMLSQRRDASGQPLRLSNEFTEQGNNLSYAVDVGKMVAGLGLLAPVLEERYRRMGANYAQSLFLLNFLPVQ